LTSDATGLASWQSGPWATSGFDIYNTNSANVGIGTGAPSQKLDVNGNVNVTGNIVATGTICDSVGCIGSGGASLPSGTSGQTLRYDASNNLVANSVLVNDGTNIGIGTTSTGAKLDVYGGNATAGHILIGNWDNNAAYNQINLNGLTGNGNYNFLSQNGTPDLLINRPSGRNIYFRENNINQLTLSPGGNATLYGQLSTVGIYNTSSLFSTVAGYQNWFPYTDGNIYMRSPLVNITNTIRDESGQWSINTTGAAVFGKVYDKDVQNITAVTDTNGNWPWTNDVYFVNYNPQPDATGSFNNGWNPVPLDANKAVLGIRIRGNSYEGGGCVAGVINYFIGGSTHYAYYTDMDVNGLYYVGQPSYHSGAMAQASWIFSNLTAGRDLGPQTSANNSGYNMAAGLTFIPPGQTLYVSQWFVSGNAAFSSNDCHVDVLYSTAN